MSFNPADHMVEEDASDLQFPKDDSDSEPEIPSYQSTCYYNKYLPDSEIDSVFNTGFCENCQKVLKEPYIYCVQCSQTFCLKCFSSGAETSVHKNTHSYSIRHDNLVVFPQSNWSGREEKKFLNALLSHGYGNWEGISKVMGTRSPDECKTHYLDCYFDKVFGKFLGLTNENLFVPEVVPFLYKQNSLEPPRFDEDTIQFTNTAGYRFARSEFETPYDNAAESIVSFLKPDDSGDPDTKEVIDELNTSIFRAYNHRLKERHRRYKIIRDHGLIIPRKTLTWMTRNFNIFSNLTTKNSSTGRFISFMQLSDGISFDFLVESLKYAMDTKKYLQRLYDLRKQGITSFAGGKIYMKLKTKRNTRVRDKRWDHYENRIDWKNQIPGYITGNPIIDTDPVIPLVPVRKKSVPLDIIGFPNYDSLTDEEKIVCSNVRLPPQTFLEYKEALINENSNRGYLRLAEARRLIKIDVNKTRQIYDFLLENGLINKSPR